MILWNHLFLLLFFAYMMVMLATQRKSWRAPDCLKAKMFRHEAPNCVVGLTVTKKTECERKHIFWLTSLQAISGRFFYRHCIPGPLAGNLPTASTNIFQQEPFTVNHQGFFFHKNLGEFPCRKFCQNHSKK